MPFRGEMDNRFNGSPEHLACLVENIGDDVQSVRARILIILSSILSIFYDTDAFVWDWDCPGQCKKTVVKIPTAESRRLKGVLNRGSEYRDGT